MRKLTYLSLLLPFLAGALEFSKVFQSNMVLQQNMPIPICGKAAPGEKITLSFDGKKLSGTADQKGHWRVLLPKVKASKENRSMILQGRKEKIVLKNILVGEVWFCSGQSNMHWKLAQSLNGKETAVQSNYPLIRTLSVDAVNSSSLQESFKGSWKSIKPENAGKLSGVGFYFARHLHQKLDIPVGLVCVTRGGTMIEPWLPCGAADKYPQIARQWRRIYKKVPGQKKPRLQDQPQNQPYVIYNGAVHAVRHLTCRGVIWYQGCSNIWFDTEEEYFLKQQALWDGWKKAFKNPDLKFYAVQIAPLLRPEKYYQGHLNVWLAQQRFADNNKNVHLVITNDVGDLKNIHPVNKEPVGRRLADLALKHEYGCNIPADFPRLSKKEIKGNKFILHFAHVSSWKTTDGKEIRNFELAGRDGKFHPAQVKIRGSLLEVSAPGVEKAAALRYMYHPGKMGNLVNGHDLPPGTFAIAPGEAR